MTFVNKSRIQHMSFKRAFCLLSAVVSFGLFVGMFCPVLMPISDYIFRLLPASRLSVVGVLVVLVIPVLCSLLVLRHLHPLWLLLFIFLKALMYGYCGVVCTVVFGCAGWLIRCFLLFSDTVCLVVLIWLFLKSLVCGRKHSVADVLIITLTVLLTGTIDFVCVSPFLFSLFDH